MKTRYLSVLGWALVTAAGVGCDDDGDGGSTGGAVADMGAGGQTGGVVADSGAGGQTGCVVADMGAGGQTGGIVADMGAGGQTGGVVADMGAGGQTGGVVADMGVVGGMPVGGMPVGGMPVGGMPVGGMPVGCVADADGDAVCDADDSDCNADGTLLMCRRVAPQCAAGTVPEVRQGCYTDVCVTWAECGAPVVQPMFCGGFAGLPCPDGQMCIDDPSDACDPNNGGADCGGICVLAQPER